MLDVYASLRACIGDGMECILHVPVADTHIDCAADGYGVRCATALSLRADAKEWAERLTRERNAFRVFDCPTVEAVFANGGHLLFTLTNSFYAALVQVLLEEYADRGPLPTYPHEENDAGLTSDKAAQARAYIAYVQRRMWMLGRKAQGIPDCPPVREAQHALLCAAGLTQPYTRVRAWRNGMVKSADAALAMLRCTPPYMRPQLHETCAHVADAIQRALYEGFYTGQGG